MNGISRYPFPADDRLLMRYSVQFCRSKGVRQVFFFIENRLILIFSPKYVSEHKPAKKKRSTFHGARVSFLPLNFKRLIVKSFWVGKYLDWES